MERRRGRLTGSNSSFKKEVRNFIGEKKDDVYGGGERVGYMVFHAFTGSKKKEKPHAFLKKRGGESISRGGEKCTTTNFPHQRRKHRKAHEPAFKSGFAD